MNTNSEPCAQAKALALPEILEHISAFLPRQDLLNCRLVNKQWNHEARKVINKKIPITFNCDAWPFTNIGLREQFRDLMAPSRPPLFSNFILYDFRSLQSRQFTLISQSIKSLTFECITTNQNRALDLILLSCRNLEYLHFGTRFDPFAWMSLISPEEQNFAHPSIMTSPIAKFNKLKFIRIKLASMNSFGEEEYKLVSNLLARAPFLEELTFQSVVGKSIWMPEPILRAINEQLPRLKYLRYLCIDYQLSNPREHVKKILNQKFKLTKLRLNESCTEILDLILAYQPRVASVELSIRNFGWDDIFVLNGQPQRYCVRELKILLIDFHNVHHGNQFGLKIKSFRGSHRGENFVAITEEFQSCVNTALYFQLNTHNYVMVQPNMLHTVRAINLRNVPANTHTIAFLTEFQGLKNLQILPAFPGVFRTIWSLLRDLEELVIHVHPSMTTFEQLEQAITGLPSATCYHMAHWHPGNGTEAEMLKIVQMKRNKWASICICQLTRLRSLEVINTGSRQVFLTQTSILTCFLKMNCLTALKFPYRGSSIPLRYLQLKSPSIYLEASEP